MTTVTVYDDISLIPSFWILGFQILQEQGKIRLRFRHGKDALISNEKRKWKSTLFELDADGAERVGIIDIFDRYDSINPEVLAIVDHYFKFNFNEAYIKENVSLYQDRLFPLGFYFPVTYRHLPFALEASKRLLAGFHARKKHSLLQEKIEDALYSFREYKQLLKKHSPLEYYTETLRQEEEDLHDFFWNINYWSPDLNDSYKSVENSNQRIAMMQMLDSMAKENKAYKFLYGFFDNAGANRDYPQYVLKPTLPTNEYLRVVARSKMSIVSRGLYDCISWRMGEHMAMGKFALVERPLNKEYIPLTEGKNVIYFDIDLSDLTEKLNFYLAHEDKRKAIAVEASRYFDQYCRPEVQVKYMINTMLPGTLS